MSELALLERRERLLLDELDSLRARRQQLLTQEKEEPAEPEVPRMLTIRKASEEVGVSYDHIRQLCLQGKLVHIRVGSKYLVNMGALYRYLNQGEKAAGE